ncbi:MAG: TerC family protein [Pseudolabrys sp.]|nr:TerC family protein [Pseudolabrys sp.]
MPDILWNPNAWGALLTLTALEVVLGIDNLVFISILTSRLSAAQAKRARAVGLSLAFLFRIALLASLTWIMGLTAPIFTALGNEISWRDIILIAGGLFLIAKATWEIHNEVEGEHEVGGGKAKAAMTAVVAQLVVIDLVFSIDSIVTAIGLADDLEVMIAAVCIAMVIMYIAANPVGDFINRHPTTKMLALAFLVLIGLALLADGFDFHIPRAYIYVSMAFAGAVEFFNVMARRNRQRSGRRR